MTSPVIQVENLGKQYQLGSRQPAALSIRDLFSQGLRAPLRRWRELAGASQEVTRFWALRDLEFSIRPGEVVGIVGHNGAGKSTLLKILSRITAPTTGRVTMRGRIASLLEVGTGFHPELTGRENIFLNGAILGMRRREIQARFDDIVAFAEVERFIDTPVKRYSSGMYVRLAFAVAAHLEPEVLVVDEVLAVGDASFQKRCLGKMENVASSGRTVLFVSHNMAAISALCGRALYLNQGRLALDGSPAEAIRAHLAAMEQRTVQPLAERRDRTGDGRLRFTGFWLENTAGEHVDRAILGQDMVFCFSYEAAGPLENVFVAFDLRTSFGQAITNCNTADVGMDFPRIAKRGVFRCRIPRFPIRAGRFLGNVYCSANSHVADFLTSAIQVDVEDGDFYGTGILRNSCEVMVEQNWSVGAPINQSMGAVSDHA